MKSTFQDNEGKTKMRMELRGWWEFKNLKSSKPENYYWQMRWLETNSGRSQSSLQPVDRSSLREWRKSKYKYCILYIYYHVWVQQVSSVHSQNVCQLWDTNSK